MSNTGVAAAEASLQDSTTSPIYSEYLNVDLGKDLDGNLQEAQE